MNNPSPTPDPVSDQVISILRTVTPMLYGFIASWLVSLGIPSTVVAVARDAIVAGLTAVLAAGWYTLWRWLEPRLPKWLVTVLLGYPAVPTYPTKARLSGTDT